MNTPPIHSMFTLFAKMLLAGSLASASAALAEDEICASCGQQVSVGGSFTHHKDDPLVVIEGMPLNPAAFREDINGTNFTATIARLPAGEYTIIIGAAETVAGVVGESVFDVASGDVALARDFDIFATSGGVRKAALISGTVDHEDDPLRGPLKISFVSSKGRAKFNTLEVKISNSQLPI